MSSKKRCCNYRVPAVSIFIVCAVFCAMVACGASLGMYFFTIGIIDDSVKREGLNQADAIGAQVSSKFISVERARNVTIGEVYQRREEMVGLSIPALRLHLNSTYAPRFLSEAAADRLQGVEVACLAPDGITTNADATGFARVAAYYEILKNGDRRFTRSLTEDDGTSILAWFVNFQNSSRGNSLMLQSASVGALSQNTTTNDTFVDSYHSDSPTKDQYYFDAYVGPDGLGYYYATSYRYFFAGSRLCEVSAYQLVDSWFGIISDTLKGTKDTHLAIVDGTTLYVIASSFQSEYNRLANCYPSLAAYTADGDGACMRKTFRQLSGTPLLVDLVSAMYEPSWSVVDMSIATQVVKRKVDGQMYYLVVKQLGNINSLRPILVWGRTESSVTSSLQRTAIIIVVCSAVGIMAAMMLVAGCTAVWLLQPMKRLEEKMQRLTQMDSVSFTSFDDDDDDEELEAEDLKIQHLHASVTGTENHTRSSADYTASVKHVRARPQRGNSVIREVDSLQYHFKAMGKALHSFSKFVPKDVVNELISSGQVASSGMRERKLTLMFVDIAGFTTICEEISNASIVSELLTLFFSANTKRLQAHGATIDKFIGDCIMCFWGAPLRVDNANFRAICSGLDLQRTARDLNETFMNYGVALSVRVGCHTGRALVGNIGSDDRINYTAMGDVVNATSRLEGINKQFFTAFLVSDAVLTGCKRQNLFVTRYVGDLTLRGKTQKLPSHQICGTAFRTMDDVPADDDNAAGEAKVTSIRHGMLSQAEGYASVASSCFIGEAVATACDIFSQHTMRDYHEVLVSDDDVTHSDAECAVVDFDAKGVDLVGLDSQLQGVLGALYMPCCREDGTVIDDAHDDAAFLALRHNNAQEKSVLVSLRKDLKQRIKLGK